MLPLARHNTNRKATLLSDFIWWPLSAGQADSGKVQTFMLGKSTGFRGKEGVTHFGRRRRYFD